MTVLVRTTYNVSLDNPQNPRSVHISTPSIDEPNYSFALVDDETEESIASFDMDPVTMAALSEALHTIVNANTTHTNITS